MDSRHDHGQDDRHFLGDVPDRPDGSRTRRRSRIGAAVLAVAGVWLALSAVDVGAGQAVLVSDFGSPSRVLTRPGFYLTWPAPVGTANRVDTRLRITLGAPQEITTRDGRRLQMQAFAAWRVPAEAAAVTAFVRAGGSGGEAAAQAIGGLLDGAVAREAGATGFDDLINPDPRKLQIAAFAGKLKDAIGGQAHEAFGVTILQTGLVRLALPDAVVAATEARMRAQSEAAAAERIAQAQSDAAEIRAEAARDSRIALAEAQTEAADIEAASRKQAADIQAKAYSADPDLYLMLRSLDTLSTMVGPSTRLVLRTDAAPFNMLVQGPPTEGLGK